MGVLFRSGPRRVLGHTVLKHPDQRSAVPTTLAAQPQLVDTVGQKVHFVLNVIHFTLVIHAGPGLQVPGEVKVRPYASKVEFDGTLTAVEPGEFVGLMVDPKPDGRSAFFDRAVKFKKAGT